MKTITERIKEAKNEEKKERLANKEVFIANVWWKSQEEYDKIVRLEFAKLDKNDYNYIRNLELVRSMYSVRKIDFSKYLK